MKNAKQGVKQEDIRLIVRMDGDYTTTSNNLGERTYEEGGIYQVCEATFAELMETGLAARLEDYFGRITTIKRVQVRVVPKVTRWFTANGRDTHYLTKGEAKSVPSNLAAFLFNAGYAAAAV